MTTPTKATTVKDTAKTGKVLPMTSASGNGETAKHDPTSKLQARFLRKDDIVHRMSGGQWRVLDVRRDQTLVCVKFENTADGAITFNTYQDGSEVRVENSK